MNVKHTMRQPLISLGTSVLLLTCAHSQDASPAAAAPAPPKIEEQEAATNETNPEMLRDPFWPIGWRPPHFGNDEASQGKVEGPAQWDRARRLLSITGLSRTTDGNYVAILKGGGIVEPGDVVSVEYESLIYTWRIVNITSDGVYPEQVGVTRKQTR